jgi:hypothetical protein
VHDGPVVLASTINTDQKEPTPGSPAVSATDLPSEFSSWIAKIATLTTQPIAALDQIEPSEAVNATVNVSVHVVASKPQPPPLPPKPRARPPPPPPRPSDTPPAPP